jgi:hypothetical protein
MPPKAAPKGAAKEKTKADLAKKQKVVEDKTFGLKNKNKSKNVQKYVQSLGGIEVVFQGKYPRDDAAYQNQTRFTRSPIALVD